MSQFHPVVRRSAFASDVALMFSGADASERLALGLGQAADSVAWLVQSKLSERRAELLQAHYEPGLAEREFRWTDGLLCDVLAASVHNRPEVRDDDVARTCEEIWRLRPNAYRDWLQNGILQHAVNRNFADVDETVLKALPMPPYVNSADKNWDAFVLLMRLRDGAGEPETPHPAEKCPDLALGFATVASIEAGVRRLNPAEAMVHIVARAMVRQVEPDQRLERWGELQALVSQTIDRLAEVESSREADADDLESNGP